MIDLEKIKRYFVVIRGPAGVGKTTIAKILAERLNASIIDIDKFLEKYGLDMVDVEKGCIDEKSLLNINDIVVPEAIEKLKQGKTIIFDGNFYSKNQLEHLLSKIKFKSFVFTLKADIEECIERDKTRKVLGENNIRDVYKLVSKFDYGIIIDTKNKSTEEIVNEIISNLPK